MEEALRAETAPTVEGEGRRFPEVISPAPSEAAAGRGIHHAGARAYTHISEMSIACPAPLLCTCMCAHGRSQVLISTQSGAVWCCLVVGMVAWVGGGPVWFKFGWPVIFRI